MRAGAKAAQETELAVAGPATKRNAVHAKACDGQQINHANAHHGAAHFHADAFKTKRCGKTKRKRVEVQRAGPRNNGECDHGGNHEQRGRDHEQNFVGTRGNKFFLHEKFQTVGDGLQQAEWAGAIWSHAVLHP